MACVAATLVLTFGHVKAQSTPIPWVSFTATYSETISNSGLPQRTIATTETRSGDGSLLQVSSEKGKPFGGKMWEGCGQILGLDFARKQAVYQRHAPRAHLVVPPVTPLGSKTFVGVQCTLYPVDVSGGEGTICINVKDDILVRQEIHLNQNGSRTDSVKELVSIDYSSPASGDSPKLPAGFQVLGNSAVRGCSILASNY